MPPERGPDDDVRRLVIVVRPGRASANAAALRCLRRLVPGALLLVHPEAPPVDADAEVLSVDAEEIAAGPLSAASALERERAAAPAGAVPSRRAASDLP